MQVATDMRATDVLARTVAALERHQAMDINLVVFGEFKRGKSTFINALLGQEVLPTGVVPLTALPTIIQHGGEEAVWVKFDDHEERHELAKLAHFVSEKENPENRLGVREVRVTLPNRALAEGLRIVDTPGFGSTHEHNTREAVDFMPHADAAVMVIGSDPPLGLAEREFLRTVREYASKLLFVQNKADQLRPEDLQEALAFNQGIIAEELGADAEVLPISAREALQKKFAGASDERFKKIEERISELSSRERLEIGKESLRRAATSLAGSLLAQLELEERLASMPTDEFEQKAAQFSDALATIRSHKEDRLRAVTETARNRLIEQLEADIERFKEDELPRLTNSAIEALNEPDLRVAITSLNVAVPAELTRSIEEWSAHEYERLQDALHSRLAQATATLAEVAEKLVTVASETFDVHLPAPDFEPELPRTSRFHFRPWEMKLELGALALIFLRIRGRAGRKRLRQQALHLAWRQLEMHCGRLRYDYVTRLDASLKEFAGQLEQAFEATAGTLERAVELARMRERENRAEQHHMEAKIAERRQKIHQALRCLKN